MSGFEDRIVGRVGNPMDVPYRQSSDPASDSEIASSKDMLTSCAIGGTLSSDPPPFNGEPSTGAAA